MMNIIQVQLPTEANKTNKGSKAVASAKPGEAASAEASANALEIADRVVEPSVPDSKQKPGNNDHHHH
jgi:hypothetical protein